MKRVQMMALGVALPMALVPLGLTAGGASATTSRLAMARSVSRAPVSTSPQCNGCGNGKTLTVLLNNWGSPTSAQAAWESAVAKQFKQATGANVKFSTYLNVTQFSELLDRSAVSHTGPDVLQAAGTYLGTAVAAGAYSSITPADWQLVGGKGRFLSGALANNLIGTPKTGPVVVPQWLNANLMAYNTKLFKEAGIAQPPTTWAQYVADGEKITKLGHGIYGSDFYPMDPLPWHIVYLLTAEYGGSFVNTDGNAATMTSGPVQKAVAFWFNLETKFHIAPPESINWTSTQANAAFAAGKLGMINLQTENVLSTVKGQPAQGDVAFAPEPSVAYGQSTAVGGKLFKSEVFSWDLGVTKWSKDPSLAYRFINIATEPANEAILVNAYQDLPSTKAALAAIPASSLLREFTKYVAEGVAAPQSSAWVTVEEATATVTATLAREVQNGTYTQATTMQALTKANEQIDAALSQAG